MRTKLVCVAAAAAGCVCAVASADVLINGDFENMPNWGMGVSGDPGYSALTGNQIPGWTVEAGHAATVHNTVFYPTITGGYSINTDGEGYNGVNANLYQDFIVPGGSWFTVEFDWLRWATTAGPMLHVAVTDLVTNDVLVAGTYLTGVGVQHATLPFVSTGNMVRLRITESGSGYNDNAFIVDNFTVTPTPGAAAVLALAGTAAGRRRR